MALDGVKNFAIVTVSTGYDDVDTSIVLETGDGAKLPDPATANFNLVWWDSTNYSEPALDPNVEIVRCTAKSTDTLTVTRAQESTSATTKNTGGATYKMALTVTAKMITDIGTDLDAKVTKALFDANTILAANSDNTPAAVTIAEQRIVSRLTGGNIAGNTIDDVLGMLTDTTTNNVSTSKHGLVPKAPNDTAKFLRGDGTWDIPGGSSLPLHAKMTSDFSTASSSYVDITGLSISLSANKTYQTLLMLRGSATSGQYYNLVFPSGATYYGNGLWRDSSPGTGTISIGTGATVISSLGTLSIAIVSIIITTTNSGTFKVQIKSNDGYTVYSVTGSHILGTEIQ